MVEVGEAVGVALPELLRVTVAVGLLEAVPLNEGVLVAVLVTEAEGEMMGIVASTLPCIWKCAEPPSFSAAPCYHIGGLLATYW